MTFRIENSPLSVLVPKRYRGGHELTRRERHSRNLVFLATGIAGLYLIVRSLSGFPTINLHFMMALYAGIACLSLGMSWRRGNELHCARCNYQVPPSGPVPSVCPECGETWQSPDTTIAGERVRTPWLIWVGVLFLAYGGWTLANLTVLSDAKWRSFPVGMLIGDLADPHAFMAPDAWDALTARTLSAEDEHRIVDALLKRLEHGGYLHSQSKWIEAVLAKPGTPQELSDRYYQACLRVTLHTPERVFAGESCRLELEVTQRQWSSGNQQVFVWLEQAGIGDQQAPIASSDSLIRHSSSNPREASRTITINARAPETPGVFKAFVSLTFVAGQYGAVPTPPPPGSDIRTPSQATYVKTVVFECAIDVRLRESKP